MDSSSILSQSMGDISGYYVPLKHYDPNSSARILCIELQNNSQNSKDLAKNTATVESHDTNLIA